MLRLSGSERVLWMVPPAANAQQQGFIRLTNRENRSGNVVVWGVDDSGQRSVGTLSFALSANASKQLNSQDLENGNAAKSVVGSLGAGSGNWRLHVLTDLDVEAMALIRTPDGFLTTIHETVAATGADWRVPMFNPVANVNQVSVLRLVNPSEVAAGVAIDGVDDAGVPAPAGQVSLTLAPNAAVELTAQDLENGNPAKGLVGRLGAGSGKWLLTVSGSAPLKVLSLLRDPKGYLTNLSTATHGTADRLDP